MSNQIVYIVSDSVGETADLVVRAAMGQFLFTPDIRRVPYVEDTGTLKEVISMAQSNHAIICFTLVKPEMRQYLFKEAAKEKVQVYDIIGPLIDLIQSTTGGTPRYEPGLARKLDEEYFKKIEAIEFAVKYDDGRDPRGILKADIVLIGLSRTSKTPLSQYLAHKRLKVANVPLVPEIDPPEELFLVPKEKCFGLKIDPEKLNYIRKERLKSLGLSDGANYANLDRINDEIKHFEKIIDRIGCTVLDVSNRAIEESASVILNVIQNQQSY